LTASFFSTSHQIFNFCARNSYQGKHFWLLAALLTEIAQTWGRANRCRDKVKPLILSRLLWDFFKGTEDITGTS
jgi:hypothetical protein